MTRDEHRKACIEALMDAYTKELWKGPHACATAAFDSLHGLARVVPVAPTAGTLNAARNYFADGLAAYEVLAEASDLTNGTASGLREGEAGGDWKP